MMVLRTFVFRVKKQSRKKLLAFMEERALNMLRHIPACRAAFFAQHPKRKDEYMWVTVWTSELALESARQRDEWKEITRLEEKQLFQGKPKVAHYHVLLDDVAPP